MMGVHQSQNELFTYAVQLDKRVRPNHPLRQILALVDFSFARAETARFYGKNGHVGVDPVILLKLMFLLFYDNVASERELLALLPERLGYLSFLGYGLEEKTPDHSVLSKARARWGQEVFESFFVRVVLQCVEKGLVEGGKIHVDSSLIEANASTDTVRRGPPQLIAALKAAYQAQEQKLSEPAAPKANDGLMSQSDPDAGVVSRGPGTARPRYHHHRAVDNAHGVITAAHTTPGHVVEQSQLGRLLEEHRANTHQAIATVVGDHKYGTVDNFVLCQKQGIRSHLGDVQAKQNLFSSQGIFPESAFTYQGADNTYRCPAGQILKAGTLRADRGTWEYRAARGVCAACALRAQCTRAKAGPGGKTAGAGSNSSKAALPTPPTTTASNGRAGGGSGASKSRTG